MGSATMDTMGSQHAMRGRFDGVEVTTGTGGGLASGAPAAGAVATHFHAARLPDFGDTVLAVSRVFDETTAAALRIELRAFAASSPGRGVLATMSEDEFVDAPGAIAYACVTLAAAGDAADERRAATLVRCVVTDAAPSGDAARGVADWLRATWEVELAFGSWPALRGTLDAFGLDGGVPAGWAHDWLRESEHRIEGDTGAGDGFLKVLSTAWLEPATSASDPAQAATDER
ncbi:MAG: hypothetical protein JWM98_2854 [Thermoleophilia bacterium]|nr:hypothetical protein [Thermoleophilia bacterium]